MAFPIALGLTALIQLLDLVKGLRKPEATSDGELERMIEEAIREEEARIANDDIKGAVE